MKRVRSEHWTAMRRVRNRLEGKPRDAGIKQARGKRHARPQAPPPQDMQQLRIDRR